MRAGNPKWSKVFFAFVLFASLLPCCLSLLGLDWGSHSEQLDLTVIASWDLEPSALNNEMLYAMVGNLTQGLFIWTAVMTAFLTLPMALLHFITRNNATGLIIGLALFCAGTIDAYHGLVLFRLVDAVPANEFLTPFTWALSRTFHAIVLIVGALACLWGKLDRQRIGLERIVTLGCLFLVSTYLFVSYVSSIYDLPSMHFPNAVIHRPYDLIPLALYFAAAPIVWKLYDRRPTAITSALLFSLIPAAMGQTCLIFGSTSLYDSCFNVAHYQQVLIYMVPFAGFMLDYAHTHRLQLAAQKKLEERSEALEKSNHELDQFAYVASHDLKAPLRVIDNASRWLEEDLAGKLDEEDLENMELLRNRVHRMEKLLDDLLEYSRVGRKMDRSFEEEVRADNLVDDIELLLSPPKEFTIRKGPELSKIKVNRMPLQQILLNLTSNAIKHHDKDRGSVEVRVQEEEDRYIFTVSDDGPGIPKQYQTKVFGMFQTLQARDKVEGSGMGLAMVKKNLEVCGQEIKLESDEGQGCRFSFTWPKESTPKESL